MIVYTVETIGGQITSYARKVLKSTVFVCGKLQKWTIEN